MLRSSHLLERVCAVFIGDPLLDTMALNEVTGFDVVWEDDDLVTHGAACGLEDHG